MLVDLAHFDQPDLRVSFLLRREHAGQRRLHLVDRVVDDVVVADVDAAVLGQLARGASAPHVETDHHRLRGKRQVDVRLRDAAHGRVDDVDLHLGGRQLGQRLRQRFVAALDVGLDDQRQRLDGVLGAIWSNMFSSFAACCLASFTSRNLPWRNSAISRALRSSPSTITSSPAMRHVGQALDLHRNRRTRRRHAACPFSSVIARTRPKTAPASTMSPRFSVPGVHEHRRHRSATFVEPRLDDDALGRRVLRRPAVPALPPAAAIASSRSSMPAPVFADTGTNCDVATVLLGNHALRDQLLLDALRVGLRHVDLVDRDHQRDAGRPSRARSPPWSAASRRRRRRPPARRCQ